MTKEQKAYRKQQKRSSEYYPSLISLKQATIMVFQELIERRFDVNKTYYRQLIERIQTFNKLIK